MKLNYQKKDSLDVKAPLDVCVLFLLILTI